MKKKVQESIPAYYIIPIILTVAAVPLIVFLKAIPLDEITYQYWTGQDKNADFFSYYKAAFTIVLAIISLVMFALARYKKLLETRRLIIYYAPIIIYALAIILSTAFSKYPLIAQRGFADRYEGAYVLLAYLVLLFSAINMARAEKPVKIIILSLFASSIVVGIIGIFQYFGVDLFKMEIARYLILPVEHRDINMSFNFGKNTIYSTLYNTNYVGSYTAMLLPLAIAAFLYVKDAKTKACAGLFAGLMFANWIGCRSRAGYIGGIIALVLLAAIMRKEILKGIKSVVLLLVGFIMIFAVMDASAEGQLGGRIFRTFKDIYDYNAPAEKTEDRDKAPLLKDIVLSGKKVSIVYGENTLSMVLEGNKVSFEDGKGQELGISTDDEGNITIDDERYSSYKIMVDKEENIFDVKLNKMQFGFFLTPDGFRIIGERNILLDSIDHPEYVGFEGKEKFASARGYIWSRSIAMLKNNLIIGGGPDTFAVQFPQHDYVGKLRAFDTVNKIVDKPHNMYLQIGNNTGVVSLIAFIFMLGVYFISSIKMYMAGKFTGKACFMGSAIFAAITGYAVAGIANDSVVSVAPVFWVLLGLGIGCNQLSSAGTVMSPAASAGEKTGVKGVAGPRKKHVSRQAKK